MAPLLENVFPVDELGALARRRARSYLQKSIPPDQLEIVQAEGWEQVGRKKKASVRVRKTKHHDVLLEDEVWSLFYRMDFKFMSGERGCKLVLDPKDPKSPTTQIDVLAVDDEVAIAIECKSAEEPRREPRFQEELAKHALIKQQLVKAISAHFPTDAKRRVVLAMVTRNLILSENDSKRAEDNRVALFDEGDLAYYRALVRQLGPAARYQFLCDVIPGGSVPGLGLTVPAIRTRMGGSDCYTFSASPEYLLKVCYVAHRAKGKSSDVDTYQRMVSRARLNKIRKYISDDGFFPTNIVISIQDPDLIQFNKAKQEGSNGQSLLGWLHLAPTYKSAWIIDGQHRLFAYSGHDRASKSMLPVLAFVGLPASDQAQLFIDINAEQKRVKKNLLQELFAELHWNSVDPAERISAVISKAIQQVDDDPDSPFHGRILKADESRDPKRCISLTTVFRALEKQGFYVVRTKKQEIAEFGPMWAVDNDSTLRRTKAVINGWFGAIKSKVPDWWDIGSGEGGGLSMNDGVTICVNCLLSVLDYLRSHGDNLSDLTDKELIERVQPWGETLGEVLAKKTADERKTFRLLRGIQGQNRGTRELQKGIRERRPEFDPPGLAEYLAREQARTTEQAQQVITEIERTLQSVVMQELRAEFQGDDLAWWFQGVPKAVRQEVDHRINEDQGQHGGREDNFFLIDYRAIIMHNWNILGDLLGLGDSGGKDKRTQWLVRVNDVRRNAMHPAKAAGVSFEDLREIQGYAETLRERVNSIKIST